MTKYVILDGVVSGEEEFDPHNVMTDGAVVTMVAVITSAENTHGYTDSETVEVVSQVTAVESYGRSDSDTVSMTGVVSGVDFRTYPEEAATVTLIGIPSGSDEVSHTYTDSATVTEVSAAVSTTDTHEMYDAHRILLRSIISSLDEHNYPPDSATITLTSIVSGSDLLAKWYEDADTALTVAYPIGGGDSYHTVDEDIITLISVPSATDTAQTVDAATTTLIGVVSGLDEHGYPPDAATITMTGVVSSDDNYGTEDADTITLVGVVSGVDEIAHTYEDADTITLVGVVDGVDELSHEYLDSDTVTLVGVVSGVEVYTPAVNNEIYFAGLFTASGKTYTGVTGGGGATWGNTNSVDNSNSHVRTWYDLNTAGHAHSDLPVLTSQYSNGPLTDHGFAVLLAAGDGSHSPTATGQNTNSGNGDNPTATIDYFTPTIGDLIVYFVGVDNSGVVSGGPPAGHVLLDSGTIGTNSWYVYARYPSTGDGSGGSAQDDRVIFRVATTGTNIHWCICMSVIHDPGTTAHVLDKGLMTDSGTDATFTASVHP